MAKIFETENFTIESPDEKPHITRLDGGHIWILPKVGISDRTKLSPSLAKELMMLTMITGEAMTTVMNEQGVDIGRINYQENGNWSVFDPKGPYLHEHIYGRAKSAMIQKYGDALHFPHLETGFYDDNQPLTSDDCDKIKVVIERLLQEDRYINF
ncbi:MAG: hypothetical protein KBC15_03330 [Candidatus Levybacteria bacterium]|nr:hypothetical protein [Candidatus Levybacteria bacterium]